MEDQYDNQRFLDPHTSTLFPTLKQCARCPKEKPPSDFHNRQSTKDGKQSYCRDCQEEDRLQRFYNFSRQRRRKGVQVYRTGTTGRGRDRPAQTNA